VQRLFSVIGRSTLIIFGWHTVNLDAPSFDLPMPPRDPSQQTKANENTTHVLGDRAGGCCLAMSWTSKTRGEGGGGSGSSLSSAATLTSSPVNGAGGGGGGGRSGLQLRTDDAGDASASGTVSLGDTGDGLWVDSGGLTEIGDLDGDPGIDLATRGGDMGGSGAGGFRLRPIPAAIPLPGGIWALGRFKFISS
jgi:hypothetical protein